MDKVNPLDQVKLDAEAIMRERMQSNAASKAWQEAHDGPVSLDDTPVVAVEQPKPQEPEKPLSPVQEEVKTVKTKKGK